MGAPAGVALRPLGIGEIIDRALTLYVQNFTLFSATVALVVFLPMAIGQYLLFVNQLAEIREFVQVLSHPGATPPGVIPFGDGGLASILAGFISLIVAGILLLFANNAVAVSIGMLYTGRKPEIGSSLRSTFSRSAQLIGLFCLWALMFFGAYVVFVTTTFGVIFGVAALGMGSSGAFGSLAALSVALMFLLIPLAICAAAVLFVLLALVFAFSGYAVVIERQAVTDALALAFRRIFNRKEIGKALVVGLVAIVLAFGINSISGIGEIVLGFLPAARVLTALWAALFAVLAAAVQTSFYAVYYYDVRIRREGFDLESALERLSPAAQ